MDLCLRGLVVLLRIWWWWVLFGFVVMVVLGFVIPLRAGFPGLGFGVCFTVLGSLAFGRLGVGFSVLGALAVVCGGGFGVGVWFGCLFWLGLVLGMTCLVCGGGFGVFVCGGVVLVLPFLLVVMLLVRFGGFTRR